jgi:hypothetical protein
LRLEGIKLIEGDGDVVVPGIEATAPIEIQQPEFACSIDHHIAGEAIAVQRARLAGMLAQGVPRLVDTVIDPGMVGGQGHCLLAAERAELFEIGPGRSLEGRCRPLLHRSLEPPEDLQAELRLQSVEARPMPVLWRQALEQHDTLVGIREPHRRRDPGRGRAAGRLDALGEIDEWPHVVVQHLGIEGALVTVHVETRPLTGQTDWRGHARGARCDLQGGQACCGQRMLQTIEFEGGRHGAGPQRYSSGWQQVRYSKAVRMRNPWCRSEVAENSASLCDSPPWLGTNNSAAG